jgi:AcrR family transcriptional regulator
MSPRRARAVRGRVGEDPATALREHLVHTADALLAERPVAGVTTRDLARAAGVSEGVLYNYFASKNDLILTALVRRYATLLTRFETRLPSPGTDTVAANLATYATALLDLFADGVPTVLGLVHEPDLLHRFNVAIHTDPYGPRRFHGPIVDYLTGESRLGRVGVTDAGAAANLLIGSVLMLAFGMFMTGRARDTAAAEIPVMVATLVRGLDPAPPASTTGR